MPTYDFECPDHGEFETAVSFANADKPVACSTKGCRKKCKRVARLYPANISYCDGMTKSMAEVDAANTRKYGHTI